jgi:hypothetical protein
MRRREVTRMEKPEDVAAMLQPETIYRGSARFIHGT